MTRGPLLSRLTVAHHRFDVSYSLQSSGIDSLALPASFTMTTTASAEGNQEVTLATYSDVANRDTFYSHNGWQFIRRRRSTAPLPAQFYPMVAALRLQDEVDASAPSSSPSRRLTIVTSHTCAASVPEPGKVELLIHRHLNQDDGRGLAEGVADNSRQEIALTFSLQSVDRLQPGLPISAAHFDDELSFNRHLLHIQHPALTFILQRPNNVQPPAGFQEFASIAAQPTALFARVADWTASQLSLVEPLTRPLPSTVHLHSLLARDAVTDEVGLRLQHVGVDITQDSDEPSAAAATAQSTVSIDLAAHFPQSVRLSEMRRVGVTLNHRRPWSGLPSHQHSGAVDADSLHPGWTFKADESTDVMDTLLLRSFLAGRQQSGGGANQNSQEQGVFISEAALRGEQDKKKRLEEEQQKLQPGHDDEAAGRRRRLLLQTADGPYSYAAEANGSQPAMTSSDAASAASQSGRRLLAGSALSSDEWSSLSLPLVRISSKQLQAFLLHIEADDEESQQREDRDPHPGRLRQRPAQADNSQRANTDKPQPQHDEQLENDDEQQQQQQRQEEEASRQSNKPPQQSQSLVSKSEELSVAPVGELDSAIPSRVEYLLILLVCLLAVSFFALALGLIPAKAIGRAWQQCCGDVSHGQHHSNGGRNGASASASASHSLPSRMYALLYAVEHWAGRLAHKMRTYMLSARYGRSALQQRNTMGTAL